MSVFCASSFVSKSSALLRGSLILGLATVITACGGGGGGGGDNTPAAPAAPAAAYPIAAPYNKHITDGSQTSVNLSAQIDGDTVTGGGTVGFTAADAFTFEAMSVLRTKMSIDVHFNFEGDSYPILINSTTYYDSNYREVGGLFVDTSYAVVTATKDLPAEGRVGDNGDLYTYAAYSGPSKMAVVGAATARYYIEKDSSSSVILRISIKYYNAGNSLTETDDFRYRINANGNLTFVSIETVSADGSEKVQITAN